MINDILTSKLNDNDNMNIQSNETIENNNYVNNIIPSPTLTIFAKNTFLHSDSMFGINMGDKIENFMYSLLVIALLVIQALIWIIFISLDAFDVIDIVSSIYWRIYNWIFCSMTSIYTILLLLAMNKTTTKKITSTFVFWLQILWII